MARIIIWGNFISQFALSVSRKGEGGAGIISHPKKKARVANTHLDRSNCRNSTKFQMSRKESRVQGTANWGLSGAKLALDARLSLLFLAETTE